MSRQRRVRPPGGDWWWLRRWLRGLLWIDLDDAQDVF